MEIFSLVVALVHNHREDETLYISAGEDEHGAPEWWSIYSLGPP